MKNVLNKKLIIVTGANRGIGYGIVEQFIKNNNFQDKDIVMTARDLNKGKNAMKELSSINKDAENNLKLAQLDVASMNSIHEFVEIIRQNYKGIDVLYNNAGVCNRRTLDDNKSKDLESTFGTNVFGVVNLTNELLPLFNRNSQIINISSLKGQFKVPQQTVDKLLDEKLNFNGLIELYKEFKKEYLAGNFVNWKSPDFDEWGAYSYSKMFLNAYNRILSRKLDTDNFKVYVNAVTPGFCSTDMGGPTAERDYYKGAETPYWMSNIDNLSKFGKKTGNFLYDKELLSYI